MYMVHDFIVSVLLLLSGAPTVSFREMIDDREGRKRKSDDDKETGSEMKKVKVKTWDGRVDSAVSKQLTASTGTVVCV